VVIRELTVEEVPQCEEIGRLFYAEGTIPGEFNPEVFNSNWKNLIDNNVGTILGAWKNNRLIGVLGGVLAPDVNDGQLVANEMFWFMLPDSRGGGIRLLKSYMKLMKSRGAKRITMVHLADGMGNRVKKLYTRLGLEPVETHYKGIL
jgi:hypothetical protein